MKLFNYVAHLSMIEAQKSGKNDQTNKIWASQHNQAIKKLASADGTWSHVEDESKPGHKCDLSSGIEE